VSKLFCFSFVTTRGQFNANASIFANYVPEALCWPHYWREEAMSAKKTTNIFSICCKNGAFWCKSS